MAIMPASPAAARRVFPGENATALTGIEVPEDVQKMPPGQKELAIKSIQIGHQILDITVNSQAYMEGMKYGKCRYAQLLFDAGT